MLRVSAMLVCSCFVTLVVTVYSNNMQTCCSFHCLSSLNWKCSTWLLFATFRFMSWWEKQTINVEASGQKINHLSFHKGYAAAGNNSQLESEPLPAESAPPSPDPCCKSTQLMFISLSLEEHRRVRAERLQHERNDQHQHHCSTDSHFFYRNIKQDAVVQQTQCNIICLNTSQRCTIKS